MRAWLAALALPVLFSPRVGDAATLRCGPELASDGASRAEVLLKCGEPLVKETRTEAVGEKVKWQGQDAATTERTVYKTLEEWTYNFGPHRLMQVVVFENGRLVDVRSGGYGR